MIDEHGYRLNVGIIVANSSNQLLLAQRFFNPQAWQFPQGGIKEHESTTQAMYRELYEELGLKAGDVSLLKESSRWYHYDLPEKFQRPHQSPLCIGQKQKWFLLRLLGDDAVVNLHTMSRPEFAHWEWVDYWNPIDRVIDFKKGVYTKVLTEFDHFLNS